MSISRTDRFTGWRFVIVSVMSLLVTACGRDVPSASIGGPTVAGELDADREEPIRLKADPQFADSPARLEKRANPEIVIHTSLGDLHLRLLADKAPVTVGTFLNNYVAREFYRGTIVHHVDRESMIIGGSYGEDLQRREPDAPIRNEAHRGVSNRRGTIAMTRDREDAHSASSEFFLNVVDNPRFDFRSRDSDEEFGYCVFGEVIEGLDVLDRIASVSVRESGEFEKLPDPLVVIYSIERVQ